MKFQSLKSWINEQDQQEIIVLYPGGFKPMTGGHLNLINKYTENPNVQEIIVLVGKGIRNGIDQETAINIAKELTKWMSKVTVKASDYPSPVLTAYKFMETAPDGIYSLASSSKGKDYERVKNFVKQHQPDGKYYNVLRPEVDVVELSVNVEPKTFEGRNDEFEGQPISASILRQDILNNDKFSFFSGYPQIPEKDKENVWNILQGIVKEAFVGTIPSGVSNYETVNKSGRYSSRVFQIVEGGAAGHMKNIWEANELTFEDLRDLINQSLSGQLKNISEKLDGQNVLFSWKDDKLVAARNKGHLKNFGENALDINEMEEFFSQYDEIKLAFTGAMKDMQDALRKTNLNLDKIFQDGKNWMNIEVLYPDTENIIPYGSAQLRIHHFREIDEEANLVNVHIKNLNELESAIQQVQNKEDETFFIAKTNLVEIDNIKDSDNIRESLIRQIQKIQLENEIDDNETIQDYIDESLRKYIEENFDVMGKPIDNELIDNIIQRWGHGVKTPNIRKLLKDVDTQIAKWVRGKDKSIKTKIKEIIFPIEKIFLQLGSTVLNNLKGLASSDPLESSQKIKAKVEKAIQKLKEESKKIDSSDPESAEKIAKFLGTQLERLEKSGGIDLIAPTEGIVFEYKDNLLKLTGNFGPINQLIGFLKFGR